MSLCVDLEGPEYEVECRCECGHEHKVTRSEEFFWANITHNLGPMAQLGGFYQALWRPDERGWSRARDLIGPISEGLDAMLSDPPKFKALDAKNGWGTYDDFLPWVRRYLDACKAHPDALVRVSR